MASIRIAADETFDADTPDGATAVVDITNDDCLLLVIDGSMTNSQWYFEGSLDGETWYNCTLVDGETGWDAYNQYNWNGGSGYMLALPTFACAPLKWFRVRFQHTDVENPPAGPGLRVRISAGIIGR